MTDAIDRQAAIDAVDSKTVSTNPEHFKSSEKFIKFMDDADIASFGEWQWANGFNTAVVAAKIQLKKLPSAQPEPQWIPCSEMPPEECGEYRITWTTSASKNRFIGDAEYEVTGEWDEVNKHFKGEWLLDEYVKNYPNVKVLAWKPQEEPWEE